MNKIKGKGQSMIGEIFGILVMLLIGFFLLGLVLMYPLILLAVLLLFLIWIGLKIKAYRQAKAQEAIAPHYQNGGIMPEGVPEDQNDEPLSFSPKAPHLR